MTDQDEGYGQDTSQDQNKGGPELPKTPKIGDRIKGLFGGNKKEEQPKQETPEQEAPQPKAQPQQQRKYKDIWSKYEEDAYDESIPWQKEVKERMKADPTFKNRWGRYNAFESSGLKSGPASATKINSFKEGRDEEERNWRRYKMAYGLSQDDDIDYGMNVYRQPNKSWDEFKQEFEEERDPTLLGRNHNRDLFNDYWDTRGRVSNPHLKAKLGDNGDYQSWYWARHSPFRWFDSRPSDSRSATDDDRRMNELNNFMRSASRYWGGGSYRSKSLNVEGYKDLSASNYQNKRIKDIFGENADDPDFFKFIDTIKDSDDPRDQALFNSYLEEAGYKAEDLDRLKEDYYHYREQQHGIGRDGKPINPQPEQPQPDPAQEPQKTEAAEAPVEGVQATVDGKPVNAEVVTENNRLPATGREGVQETPQDVTQYKEPRETYVEPDDHPGPYTGAPKELGAGPEQKAGDGAVPAPALGAAGPPGGGKEPADEDDDDKDKGTFQAQYDLKAERNALAKQHATKFLNAFAQTAAEMGGQMASKGWDLAGNIVKMTFTQPHAMSSTSRMIGTAMSALQTAGDFADRSVQKYGIDVNADPNLMKNTIRYKLYKREAEMGKNTVGNTFRTISESLGNMGLQDASQMTPDQLDQHVQDMRAEADRLTQALKDPKLSNSERSLIKAQAQHLQGYMDGLAKQGAGMAQDQRIAARRQKRQDLATRRQNYQVLADGSPNPYREALEWADPRFGIEVDPQTGRPTNPSAYNRMLNAVITQHQNEAAAAARARKKLDPVREKWFNDLQNKIYNDIQAMKQDKAENPLRGRAEIYARIGRVAPGFEKYIDNIEQTGTFPSNSTQSTRAIRKVLADYLFELKKAKKDKTPEYNHARALLTAMDKYNNMKKLMSRIAGIMPHGAERAKRIHEATENDPYAGLDFSDNGKISDYVSLVRLYANLMTHLPRDPLEGGKFNPDDSEYRKAEQLFNNNLTYFVNKWFPGAGWGKDKGSDDSSDNPGDKPGDKPGDGDKKDTQKILDDILNPEVIDEKETNGVNDEFIKGVFNELKRSKEKVPEKGPEKVPEKPPVKVGQYAHPKTEQDNKFLARFPNYITVNTWLKSRGITSDKNPHMSLENYNKIRDFALKSGVSPEVFDSSPFATRHLPFEMMNDPIQQVIYDQKYRPGKERRNYRVKPVKGWEAAFSEYLSNNPEIRDLMSKNARGEDLTAEESAKVMQALVQNRFRGSSKLTPPGKKKVEDAEALVEEEAEQSQLPAVTENDFIKPEVASQFKDAKNIESINEGLKNIESIDSNVASEGYDKILGAMENELGTDAVMGPENQDLFNAALRNGSSKALSLKINSMDDPDEKLKAIIAGRMVNPKSDGTRNILNDFIKQTGGTYSLSEINTLVNDLSEQVEGIRAHPDWLPDMKNKVLGDLIDSVVSGDLDPRVKTSYKAPDKEKDETPSDEEVLTEKDVPETPETTELFEQNEEPELESSGKKSKKKQNMLKDKAERDALAKYSREALVNKDNTPLDIDSTVQSLIEHFESLPKRGGLSPMSKERTILNKIGKWAIDNKLHHKDGSNTDKILMGLFVMMVENGFKGSGARKRTKAKDEVKKPSSSKTLSPQDQLNNEAEHKKAIESMILKVGPQGDVDDPSTLQKEFDDHVSKLTEKLQEKYKADFQEAVGKRKISNIGKGAFKSPDPSKWLDEIRATEDAAELERMKGAYEKYIQASDEKVRKGMQERLDRAYANSEVHKVADKIVDRLVDRILSHSSLTDFEDNKDEYQKEFDKSLVGLTDEKKAERKKLWKDRLMAASDAKKAIANHFPDVDAKDLVGEDKAKLIQRLPAEVLKKYEGSDPNEGPNALDAYKKILKFAYPGSDVDKMTSKLMEQIEKVVNPPVNKSLSVRDLFRARNPDWE